MAENLACGETSESWIIDNDDETNYGGGGFMNEIDDYNHKLFSKDDNFGSIPMMLENPSSPFRQDRIKEMFEREIDFLPGSDYIKRLRSGDFDLCVRRNQALDWILKV